MRIREPLYRSIARVAVPTDRRRVQAVAEDIVAGLARLTPGPTPQGEAPGFSD